MSISTGKASRMGFFGRKGGPRALLKAKHGGGYVNRPGIYGKTRVQKLAARASSKKQA